MPVALGLWAVGVQLNELVAAVGAYATLVLVAVDWCTGKGTADGGRADARALLRQFWPLGLFVAWCALAALLAARGPTGTGVARLADWLLLPVAAVAWQSLPSHSRAKVATAAGVVMLLSCAVAAAQHFGAWPPLEAFASWEWTRLPFARMYEPVPGSENRFMAGGLLLHRLRFANVTSLVVLMLGGAGLLLEGRRRVMALSSAAVGFVAVATLPHARAALAALALGLSISVLVAVRRQRIAVVGALAVVSVALALTLLVPSLRERFQDALSSQGNGDRAGLWATGWSVVREHPMVGVGLGRFRPADFAGAEASPWVKEHTGKAHNQWLTVAAESGVVAAGLLTLLLAVLTVRWWRARPQSAPALGAVLFFALVCLTHDPLFHAEVSLATMLAFGIGLSFEVPYAGRFTAVSRR